MHIIRPLWLTHGGEKKDFEVYSCHVSPDGERLVTAAGGKPLFYLQLHRLILADGHVRIWSTEAIYNAADPNQSKPKRLASMSYHSGTIHTVRFSPSGKYLASGADDKIVCIYVLDPNAPTHTTFGKHSSLNDRFLEAMNAYDICRVGRSTSRRKLEDIPTPYRT
jgi:protein HIRA/HIR1